MTVLPRGGATFTFDGGKINLAIYLGETVSTGKKRKTRESRKRRSTRELLLRRVLVASVSLRVCASIWSFREEKRLR